MVKKALVCMQKKKKKKKNTTDVFILFSEYLIYIN